MREYLLDVRIVENKKVVPISYLLEVIGTDVLVKSLTLSGSGTGVSSTATKNRFWAYERLTSCPSAMNAQRFGILRLCPSIVRNEPKEMRPRLACWPHQK